MRWASSRKLDALAAAIASVEVIPCIAEWRPKLESNSEMAPQPGLEPWSSQLSALSNYQLCYWGAELEPARGCTRGSSGIDLVPPEGIEPPTLRLEGAALSS